MTLRLTEQQEKKLTDVVAQAETNTEVLYNKGIELDQLFNNFIKQIKDVI